jgi:3',5'-cyclic AMP phosphodiesterase CpdA
VVTEAVIAHISDLHFGVRVDLRQLHVLERFLPTLALSAIVVSGDLTQRARHGEFQAAKRYLDGLAQSAPVHVVPGNHDTQWWQSFLNLRGTRPLHGKYRRYFGEDLTPVLRVGGLVIAGALSANGISPGSLTWNPNDMAVKGNLPRRETDRLTRLFAAEDPAAVRCVVLHHNVMPGVISRRWGLSRPHLAQRRLAETGADLVLCGHDHTEGVDQIDGKLVVSTAGTHSVRTRGGRPSGFNLIAVSPSQIRVDHYVYEVDKGSFRPGPTAMFARHRLAAQPLP